MEVRVKIRQAALGYLAIREHSQAELYRKLTQKNYSPILVNEIVSELANENLQSDKRYVESYINSRALRGYGPVRIKQELIERGISEELIAELMHMAEIDWQELAKKTRAKKFANDVPSDFNELMKQKHFLFYRGFSSEQINICFADD